MKILIVDDEPLARERIREMLNRHGGIEFVGEASNGADAVRQIRKESPDVVFLDIQMPDMSGFGVLDLLSNDSESAETPSIIFVTAYEEHAVRAFEHQALDYLLKPFDRERFAVAFERARKRKADKAGSTAQILRLLETMRAGDKYLEWLTVKKDERILMLKVANIHWVEANGNYLLVKLADGSHILRGTINNIETRLDPSMFRRIHRSTIVNVNHIKELQLWVRGEYRVVMKSGHAFSLSRGYRDGFNTFLDKRSI